MLILTIRAMLIGPKCMALMITRIREYSPYSILNDAIFQFAPTSINPICKSAAQSYPRHGCKLISIKA